MRLASKAIKKMHNRERKSAEKLLKECKEIVERLVKEREFAHHCFIAFQEYVEAEVVYNVLFKKKVPPFKNYKKYGEAVYVLALADSVGELKRAMYEKVREGKSKEARALFSIMENIYDALMTLAFSNAILPDFKRKQDAIRIQLDRAQGELISLGL